MANRKNQHFVPRFYQYHFSLDNTNIGAYIIKDKKIIISPIKHTASKDYMYSGGEEEDDSNSFEELLSKLEGTMAEVLQKIISNPMCSIDGYSRFWILFFILLQDGRTELSSHNMQKVVTEILKKKMMMQGMSEEKIEKILDILWKKPARQSVENTISNLSYCLDLEMKILVNSTSLDFITSDNPVCKLAKTEHSHPLGAVQTTHF